jgi:hypothetical protein
LAAAHKTMASESRFGDKQGDSRLFSTYMSASRLSREIKLFETAEPDT